ncbi:kinase-like domain-containing protein [Rhizophagus irregularis DAOM 181602=DAOM 197198]|nr:kinase-like domain-containing protein [Rhizophagus irregularis DAOM 181602=DAOM 197198]
MGQLINHKHKIDFLLSDNTSLGIPIQTTIKQNHKSKMRKMMMIVCSECNKKRKRLDENHQICHVCYKAKSVYIPSGNKVIDDFIMHTLTSSNKLAGKMVFVPYNQFKDVKFIAEGGFSKVYKAIWIDGPIITKWNKEKLSFCKPACNKNYEVVLKKLKNSKDITSEKLNELRIFHEFSLNWKKRNFEKFYDHFNYVSKYFGITQDPVTKDIMIIMPYYKSGDLANYITNDYYNMDWRIKLDNLRRIAIGLVKIHHANILHRDFHSGNIFFHGKNKLYLGDLGLSKSATEAANDDNNEDNYEYWNSDPNKRPVATDIYNRIGKMNGYNCEIMKSSDIGPVSANDPGAIYRSRPLSSMIQSAMFTISTRSLRSQSITAEIGKYNNTED